MTARRAALYARTAAENPAALAAQLAELRAEAARRGYAIVGEYVDDGWNGATLDRGALTALRAHVRNGGVDVVLVQAGDRLSRHLGNLVLVVDEIARHGTRVESFTGVLA